MNCPTRLLTLFVSLIMLGGCTSAQSGPVPMPTMPAMLVKTAPVNIRQLPNTGTFVGTLKSRKSVNLKSQVEGRVLSIFVRSGDIVAAGTPIMQLDKSKQATLVSNASASIESSIADSENARAMVKSLQSTRLSKLANVKFAQRQYARYQKLADEGAVAFEAVDQWRNALTTADSEVQAVDAQIKAQEATLSKAIKQTKQANAAMQEQEEQLRYFTVRAPFTGEVGDIPVRMGDYVTTDTTLTTVDQTRPLELYVQIPTTAARGLKKGLIAQVLDDNGKVEQSGQIFYVAAQVDPKDQCILAKAEISNQAEKLRSGQEVNARIIWGSEPTLLVPVTAVSRFTGQDFVFIANKAADGKVSAKQKAVKLAAIEGNDYRVESGLNAGEQVIVSGIQNLSDGAAIRTGE